ncbi:MAG: hypothetical protein OHK0024_27000 [Thalassobaculales bacterium]
MSADAPGGADPIAGLARAVEARLRDTLAASPPDPAAAGAAATAYMAGLYAAVDQLAASAAAAFPPPRPLACRAGCAHCCRKVAIAVSAAEAAALAAHLRQTRPPEALAALAARFAEAARATAGLSPAERLSGHTPCPLLGADDRCTAYAFRPMACRSANSVSEAACRLALGIDGPPDRAATVPLFRPPAAVYQAAMAALGADDDFLAVMADRLSAPC